MKAVTTIYERLKARLALVIPISRKSFTSNNTILEAGMAQVIDSPTEKSLSIILTDGSILKLEASDKIDILHKEGTVRVTVDGLFKSKHLTPAYEWESLDPDISIDSKKWDFVTVGPDLYLRTISSTGVVQLVMKMSRSDHYVTGIQFFGPAVGFNGSAPVNKAADPGTATGTDAAVINAIATALRNVGLIS